MSKKRGKQRSHESPGSARPSQSPGRKRTKGAGSQSGKKGSRAEDDVEADKMVPITGMTSFQEYGHALMRATDVVTGQKWKEDGSNEVWVLRDKNQKMIATWTSRSDSVAKEDRVMCIHETYAKKVQRKITTIQKDRAKHRSYAGAGQLWLEGVYNPRWTPEECLLFTKENGWLTATIESNPGPDTSYYIIRLFPGKGSIKMVWYIGERVGFQGTAPDGESVTLGSVADAFDRKYEQIAKALKGGVGGHAFESMKRAQSVQSRGEGERGQRQDK